MQSGLPLDRLATDIIGKLPVTDSGNRYILVVSDHFIRWTECFAMLNMEAKTVAQIDYSGRGYCKVGECYRLSNWIKDVYTRETYLRRYATCCKYRKLILHLTICSPMVNRTLVAMLSSCVNLNHTDWDNQLPYLMMTYRSAELDTTGFSPNSLMLGTEPKML